MSVLFAICSFLRNMSFAILRTDVYLLICYLLSIVGYSLLLTLIEYKTLVMRGDLERASQVLPTIPPQHHNR